jgi:hypothetical protein
MYILNFFISSFKNVGNDASSIFCLLSPTSAADADTTDESTPLVDESQDEYQPIDGVSRELGLTDSYVSWVDSDRAYSQMLLAVLLFFTVAVIGYSFIFDDFAWTDSVYLAVVIFTTVGTYALLNISEEVPTSTYVKTSHSLWLLSRIRRPFPNH